MKKVIEIKNSIKSLKKYLIDNHSLFHNESISDYYFEKIDELKKELKKIK